MHKQLHIFMIIIILSLFSCTTNTSLIKQIRNTPAKNYENYQVNFDLPISDRLSISNEIVLDYLKRMDNNDSYSIYLLSESEKDMLKEYIELLPGQYKEILKNKLIGIYFINNLYGNGIADYVVDENNEIYTILIINSTVFNCTVSELVTEKENSCYNADNDNINLNIEINDAYTGLLYILLHETTHIVDYCNRITPYVEPNYDKITGLLERPYKFTYTVWKSYNQYNENIIINNVNNLHYYENEPERRLSQEEMIEIYKELKETPFASLYSCKSWAEDIAEYYTFYYMVEKLGLDYTIRIYNGNDIIYEYRPFDNPIVKNRIEDITIFN